MLINDRLGTTTALDPQCQADALGPPWVLLSCPYGFELYSLTDGTRQAVTPAAGLPPWVGSEPRCAEMDEPCAPPGRTASGPTGSGGTRVATTAETPTFSRTIKKTGELRGDPTNKRTFADLNSPARAHKTCPGVRLLRNPFVGLIGGAWGSLTPDGQFALALGTRQQRILRIGFSRAARDPHSTTARLWQTRASNCANPGVEPGTRSCGRRYPAG